MKVRFSYYLRKVAIQKDGKIPIYINLRVNKQRKQFSTGISLHPRHWSTVKSRVKMSDPKHKTKNELLDSFEFKVGKLRMESISFNRTLTVDSFKDLLIGGISLSFTEYAEKRLKQREPSLKKETIKAYNSNFKKLREFKNQISFSDLSYNFVIEYENFLYGEKNNNINTVAKAMTFLKLMIKDAIKDKYILRDDNPFDYYRIKTVEGSKETLTAMELEKLENLYNENTLTAGKNKVLRHFLFSCYTGLRFNDLKNLKLKDICENNFGKYLRIKPRKTDRIKLNYIELPLISKAIKLVDDESSDEFAFNMFAGQVTNRYLKDIMTKAEISKNITFHCARHTFGTLAGYFGIGIEIIKELMSHSDIKTTLLYRKVNNEELTREMKKWI